jgi:hypothetical protein
MYILCELYAVYMHNYAKIMQFNATIMHFKQFYAFSMHFLFFIYHGIYLYTTFGVVYTMRQQRPSLAADERSFKFKFRAGQGARAQSRAERTQASSLNLKLD